MVTCGGCGRSLITSPWTGRCVFCGKKANAFRAGLGRQRYTRRGQRKAALREIAGTAQHAAAMSWQEAEVVACDWMRRNGYRDAALTQPGIDGGIDVTSKKAIAQVKHHAKPVGLAEMQRLSGIAQSTGRKALFFSTAGYTPRAKEWARNHGIEMYRLPVVARVR